LQKHEKSKNGDNCDIFEKAVNIEASIKSCEKIAIAISRYIGLFLLD